MADTKNIGLSLQGFLNWYDSHRGEPTSREALDALIRGGETEKEKLQFIRDEIAAARKTMMNPGSAGAVRGRIRRIHRGIVCMLAERKQWRGRKSIHH
jgi:hypothetical protein